MERLRHEITANSANSMLIVIVAGFDTGRVGSEIVLSETVLDCAFRMYRHGACIIEIFTGFDDDLWWFWDDEFHVVLMERLRLEFIKYLASEAPGYTGHMQRARFGVHYWRALAGGAYSGRGKT